MYDVLIVGAGVSGLYQLHRARELGLSAHIVEAGSDVGGTWYWNRYPGARFDSESYSYEYSFSQELLDEWHWSEHFAGQPETFRYLRHVADKFGLRPHITFGKRVTSATWDEDGRQWMVGLDDGASMQARFLVTAIGALSIPNVPEIPGLEKFRGRWFHTADWPRQPLELEGKRAVVIGTGATGVQVIQELAKSVAHLTVLQRTPNWCAPLRNAAIDDDTQRSLRERAKEMFARCHETYGGFLHDADRRKAMEVSEAERTAFYEELYARRGFALWMGNFRDVLVDERANATLSAFMAEKIRRRVHDPAVAAMLTPSDHGFGTRRVPLETAYYEVYNQPNVELVDLRATPIVEVTESGVATTAGLHACDILVLATGFDAIMGPFDRIDIRGVGGLALRDAWQDGPRTYLGLGIAGFPNLFNTVGPQNAATFCNMPRCIEHNVEFISDLLGCMSAKGLTRVDATLAAQDAWSDECDEMAQRMLFTKVDSWFTGRNAAVHRAGRPVLLYTGGLPKYRERCEAVAAQGYAGFDLS